MIRSLETDSVLAPVDEVLAEREPRQHNGGQVVRIERSVALRRPEDAVIQRSRVVVAEFAQRVRDAVRALGKRADGIVDRPALTQRSKYAERGPEHRRIVLLENGLPCDCQNLRGVARAGDLVQPYNGPHFRFVPQATLQQTRVAEHERRDGADTLRPTVMFGYQIERLRERTFHLFFLKHGACSPDRVRDLVCDDLAGPAEPGGGCHMRVDALFRLLQVQFKLVVPPVVPYFQSAPIVSRSLPKSGLLVYLDEARGRLGEASVMSLKSSQYAAPLFGSPPYPSSAPPQRRSPAPRRPGR